LSTRGSQPIWSGEKLEELKTMLQSGRTYAECADYYSVSVPRIGQIVKKYLADAGLLGKKVQTASRKKAQEAANLARLGRTNYRHSSDLQRAFHAAFQKKRQNTKRPGSRQEFTLKIDDIEWVTHCPVLGIELDWFAEKRADNSPSFDRIDPSLGYIPGNVAVISWRANRIKNDGSADEHLKIYNWLNKSQQM